MSFIRFETNKQSKYKAQPTVLDGVRFASKREAFRYGELRLLERAGNIVDLECQPRYLLALNGVKLGTYVADFRYTVVPSGEKIVEDVKSEPTKTSVYRLKKKLMLALYGIEVREVF